MVAVVVVLFIALGVKAQTLSIQRVTRVTVDGDVGSSYEVQVNDDVGDTNGWKTQWIVDIKSTELEYGIIDDSTNSHRFYRTRKIGSPVGQVVTSLSATSPLERLVQISSTAETDNVLLGKFEIKSKTVPGTLRRIAFELHCQNAQLGSLFADVKLSLNGHTYSADNIPATAIDANVVFSNMNDVLFADQPVTLSVYGRVKADGSGARRISGAKVSVGLVTGTSINNPIVEDSVFQTMSVIPTILSASTVTFSSYSAVVSGTSASLGGVVVDNNIVIGQSFSFTATITAGDDTLYISSDPFLALAVDIGTIMYPTKVEMPKIGIVANPGSISGDYNVNGQDGFYVIPAGSSRTFTWNGFIDNRGGTHGTKTVKVGGISIAGGGTAYTITYGLEALVVSTTL